MRKKIAFLLCAAIIAGICFPATAIQRVSAADRAAEVINAIGIMETDKGNTTNSNEIVTRARFAQMLVNSSVLKDNVTNESNVALYSDVKKSYWAAGYIQTAINQGWMSGYLNGTFKPDQGITLQEAAYAVLKLLGYSSSDFTGNMTSSIMKLYQTKELDNNIEKAGTKYLNVRDCTNLFYNVLNATNKEGKVYASVLGYTIDAKGELDYLSLINKGVEGPIVVDNDWVSELPFLIKSATIYRNGDKCSYSDITDYDVVYYSESFKTLWVYDDKVIGNIESIEPNYTAPTSVIVGGDSYAFVDSDVAMKFSAMGDVKKGDVVTLLLGKDGSVVDVLNMNEYNAILTGVVIEQGSTLQEDTDGSYTNVNYVVFVDAAGREHTQNYKLNSLYLESGDLVQVAYKNGTANISEYKAVSQYFSDYTFSEDGSAFGNRRLASNVKMLDYKNGQYQSIYIERMCGVKLTSSSVLYYATNQNNEISELIFYDATGDLDSYGIFTGTNITSSKMEYQYLIGKDIVSATVTSLANFNSEEGPSGFTFINGSISGSYALNGVTVTSVGAASISYNNGVFPLDGDYNVYLFLDDEYILTTLDKVNNLSQYTLRAYYDTSVSLGGRIRVMVAYQK